MGIKWQCHGHIMEKDDKLAFRRMVPSRLQHFPSKHDPTIQTPHWHHQFRHVILMKRCVWNTENLCLRRSIHFLFLRFLHWLSAAKISGPQYETRQKMMGNLLATLIMFGYTTLILLKPSLRTRMFWWIFIYSKLGETPCFGPQFRLKTGFHGQVLCFQGGHLRNDCRWRGLTLEVRQLVGIRWNWVKSGDLKQKHDGLMGMDGFWGQLQTWRKHTMEERGLRNILKWI